MSISSPIAHNKSVKKLDDNQVKEIYKRALEGTETNRAIAEEFGVPEGRVSEIKTGRKYSRVTGAELVPVRSRLSKYQVKEIFARVHDGESPTALGREFGVSRRTVYHIKDGATWSGAK